MYISPYNAEHTTETRRKTSTAALRYKNGFGRNDERDNRAAMRGHPVSAIPRVALFFARGRRSFLAVYFFFRLLSMLLSTLDNRYVRVAA